MTNGINTRELILQILLEIEEEGKHSHIAIRNALSKYQFLPRQERAFITRVCEGTLEYRILIDYIIDSYSKVTVDKMKPVIREILRSAVYQIRFMDSVPDSAVCNEAVKLAQRKGFYSLKPFVNGVLRTIAREWKNLKLPSREENLVRYLSVRYSMPETLVNRWLADYGEEKTEKILADFLTEKPITTTGELTEIIRESIPMKMQVKSGHPAKRTFQAIRIELNRELDVLRDSLDGMIDILDDGGRLCIITFHSLEDRIVKTIFRKNENPCTCPSDFPVCVCGKKSKGKVITRKPILPGETEMEENPRSKSAKLRIFERVL